MRTTLDIEDDVLQAAKEIASKERSTAGLVLSRLARAGLRGKGQTQEGRAKLKHGVPVFPARRGEVVTLEHVQKLMDEEGI
jgi:hypothetical protein